MAKVVSTKFGNRQLVQLPPVSYSRSKSAEVPSIAPRYQTDHGTGGGGHTDRSTFSVVQGQHGYNIDRSGGRSRSSNAAPLALAEGNIVRDINNPGPEFRFVQPNVGSPGVSLHYTPYAREQAQQVQQQSSTQPQIQPPNIPQPNMAPAQPMPAPAPTVQPDFSSQYQGINVFYGPNGEVLPGPPQGFQIPGFRPKTEPLKDFVVDGLLHYGRLVTVSNIDTTNHFPKLPDYLLNALKQKYGQFERTDVRIAYRAGQFNVHGIPNMPMAAEMPPLAHVDPISYGEPVEIVEYIYPGDEEYDEAKSTIERDESRIVREDRGRRKHRTTIGDRGYRQYIERGPVFDDRGYGRDDRFWTAPDDLFYRRRYDAPRDVFADRRYRRYEMPRTAIEEDPMKDLRWKKERATIVDDRKYKF